MLSGAAVQVHAAEPPVFAPVKYHETRASQLRHKHVQLRRDAGHYELRTVKEQREKDAAQEELRRRAKAHVAREQSAARRRILQEMHATVTENIAAAEQHVQGGQSEDLQQAVTQAARPQGLDLQGAPTGSHGGAVDAQGGVGSDKEDASPKIKSLGMEQLQPGTDRLEEAYRRSRHDRIESEVSNMTREMLATAGLDVLRFVEGSVSAKQTFDSIKESVPRNRGEVMYHPCSLTASACLTFSGVKVRNSLTPPCALAHKASMSRMQWYWEGRDTSSGPYELAGAE